MTDEFDGQLAATNFNDGAQDLVAVITSVSPLEVLFKGQTVGAINGIPNQPLTIGDPVRVTRFAQQLVVASNMAVYPIVAVVSAFAAGTANCTVVAGDDTFDAQTVGTYTPVVGDRVVLFWMANTAGNAKCFCARRGAAMASPTDPPAAPDLMNATSGADLPTPPPPASGPGTAVLLAQQTANYINGGGIFVGDQGRYWLYSGYRGGSLGDVIDGFWFYGDQPSKVKGATVTKIEMWVQRATGVGPSGATDFGFSLHNAKTRPASEPPFLFPSPEFITLSLKPGQSGWFNLPLSWGTLIAASGASGVMSRTLFEEPYKALYGIDHTDPAKRNAQSGALRITYTRS